MCVRSSSGWSMNLPFGPIIRIPWPIGRSPQERRERPALDEPDVELVALGAGHGRRRRDRVRPLHDLAVDHHPDRHVLAGLERRRLAVEPDPEVGERIGLVLATDESGVVLGGRGVDPGQRGAVEVGHGAAGRSTARRWRRPSYPAAGAVASAKARRASVERRDRHRRAARDHPLGAAADGDRHGVAVRGQPQRADADGRARPRTARSASGSGRPVPVRIAWTTGAATFCP